jgi:transcriptional regulator with XRE-family HTH domain
MEISDLVSLNLKTIRKKRGVTQRFIAESAGVNVQTIRDIEAGRRGTSLELLGKIAHSLNVKASDMLESSEPAPVLQLPVSKTLQKLMAIPDRIYDLAQDIGVNDKETWESVEDILEEAILNKNKTKSVATNKS